MNRAFRAYTSSVGMGLFLALSACASNQFGSPCPIPDKASPEQRMAAFANCTPATIDQPYDARVRNEIDILFVIDNSPSMTPKQLALASKMQGFIQAIDNFPNADYHVAIATSDVGSTMGEGMLWSDPNGTIAQCNTFKGDDGLLQVKPCTQRTNGSQFAQRACQTLCTNPLFTGTPSVTTDGKRYISKVLGKTNVPQDNVQDAFKCASLVGDGGCGIEGQLEGALRAVDGHLPENGGFYTPGAYLAVIFITDEDDCSVQLSRRNENSPITRDCSTADKNAGFDCYSFDYRCLARSLDCDQEMNTPGEKTNCKERANNYLEPIKKYHDAFLKIVGDPNKLIVAGIWTKPSIDNGGKVIVEYQGASTTSPNLNRALGNRASCQYTGKDSSLPDFQNVVGQAQLRLSSFASSFGKDQNGQPIAAEYSVCDLDNFGLVMENIAKKIESKLAPICLPAMPKQLSPGQPNCLVGDVDAMNPNALGDVYYPACSETCCQGWASSKSPTPADAAVQAACAAETKSCYCVVKSSQADICSNPGQVVGGVWRVGGASQPYGKVTNFKCSGGGGYVGSMCAHNYECYSQNCDTAKKVCK